MEAAAVKVAGVVDHAGANDDMGDGMQCSDHPYRNNPGGICAFCLQEKLGKLVTSSFPLPVRASSSSSSSPSFRSDLAVVASSNAAASASIVNVASSAVSLKSGARNVTVGNGRHFDYNSRRARIPFLLAKKKKKISMASSSASDRGDIVFKRSKSTATPRRGSHFLEENGHHDDFSPRKRGFWSFLYHSSSSSSSSRTILKSKERCLGSSSLSKKSDIVIEDDDDGGGNSPNQVNVSSSSFERKVSRSRSVGCGSRSFSGDFFERISTGFGDCTLRRVESQREGKQKVNATSTATSSHHHHHHHHHMKERVKCGGIFGGFIMTSSSSSSSSSSYWVSSSAEDHVNHANGKSAGGGPLVHGRSRSWGWAFASPMRAFSKPKDGKRDHIIRETANKNTTPNLSAIPSLLAVRG